ncbi:hypothetical protein [Sphingopyxis sp. MWB1]|uniref:hypothetical protein n=1 Tax=Sphingopyxis sp. MWB1 TaxID=1537715 RepID=UPI000A5586CA|nr:hypothetical protein [Sphingopyxis sp. MWB1]
MRGASAVSASEGGGGRWRDGWLLPFCLSLAAGLCATFLSGLNFPEQNNRWQIPVVLDFAGSAEGPHDEYTQSFANFISLFWIAIRSFTDEQNIQTVFVAIQLAGNALLAGAIFMLIRAGGQSSRPTHWGAAWLTAFLCFAYGLWGATPLGYSEIFVTYATHTQYAIALALFSFALLIGRRPYMTALLLGVAANINLFMAVWSALAAGLALIALQRRAPTRQQFLFSAIFLTIAAPVTLWGLTASEGGGAIPVSFFRTFLAGHIYALDYPQAFVQTFALLITATLAIFYAQAQAEQRRLAIVMAACTGVLGMAAVMPYAADVSLLLLLHPLRFTSIPVVLAAICAASLCLAALKEDSVGQKASVSLFAAALALAGFMLKQPLLSSFGFALAIAAEHGRARMGAHILAAVCALATLLPAPGAAISAKAALSFAMASGLLALVALLKPEDAPLRQRVIAISLGAIATVPLVGTTQMAAPLAAAAILSLLLRRGHVMGLFAAMAAFVLVLWGLRDDPLNLGLMAGGGGLLLLLPSMRGLHFAPALARAALVAFVPLLCLAGLANGARHQFAPSPTPAQRDFLAAQQWARANTPRDAVFLPVGMEQGFALFSRRPIWWEQSQGAAVLWQPSFLPTWEARKRALEQATTADAIERLARREAISYLVVPLGQMESFSQAKPIYTNDHVAILDVAARVPDTRSVHDRVFSSCPFSGRSRHSCKSRKSVSIGLG